VLEWCTDIKPNYDDSHNTEQCHYVSNVTLHAKIGWKRKVNRDRLLVYLREDINKKMTQWPDSKLNFHRL